MTILHWFLNNNSVSDSNSQKQLSIALDNRLSFEEHLTMILNNVSKIRGLLRKLHNILPRPALLTMYKHFFRPHLDTARFHYLQSSL